MKKIIIIGILLSLVIEHTAKFFSKYINQIIDVDFIPGSFGIHTLLFVLSVLAILLLKNQIKFRIVIPKLNTLLKPIILGILVGLFGSMIMGMIQMSTATNTGSSMEIPLSSLSLTQIILFVFLYSSIAEEMLFRGVLLNFLKPLKEKGITLFKRKISYGVLISGVLFGLYHIMPDKTAVFTIPFVINTALLGLVAGYYQEKYDNFAYAIIVHMAGNLVGVAGMAAMTLSS